MADFDINSTLDPNKFDITGQIPEFDIGAQKEEGQSFLDSLRSFLGEQESLSAASDRIGKSLGLPQLREEKLRLGEISDDLTSSLFGLPDQIAGTTRNSLVTQGQRQNLIQSKAQPLQSNLARISEAGGRVGARLSSAEAEQSKRLGLAEKDKDRALLPFELGFSLLEQTQAREFAGYEFREQAELDRLVANQLAGVSLSQSERKRLTDLSIKEMGFRNALEQIRASGDEARKTKKAPQDLGSLFSSIFG